MKKGSDLMPTWLVNIILAVLEIASVALIIGGIIYVFVQGQKDPQEMDFARVLKASAKLLNDYDEGKMYGKQEINVPIASEKPMDIAFYPDGGGEAKCKGRACMCMYHLTADGPKTTCKTIDVKQKCTTAQCGGELCAGSLYPPTPESKGGKVTVKIECTTEGSQFIIA